MKVAMLRIGADTGNAGIHGPLFKDGSFEYIPIPDGFGIDQRTYGNTYGKHGRLLVEYFPESKQHKMMSQSIHYDPEFTTFTYWDPTPPKAGLAHLEPGDMLIFYCGLQASEPESKSALYLIGYFEVLNAGKAKGFSQRELMRLFGNNFHIMHSSIFMQQRESLVLVKGGQNSRLLTKAVLISTSGKDRSGRPIQVLSSEMQKIFSDFNGKICFQRSPTRWVLPVFTPNAAAYMRALI